MLNKRNRTPSKYIVYALQLYFSGLSLRRTSQQLSCFVKRNHISSIWKWIQHYKPMKILQKRRKVSEFIIDETLLKIGNQYAWIWVGQLNQQTQSNSWYSYFLWENNSCCWKVYQRFDKEIWKTSTFNRDGGTWYSQACRFVKMKHHLHSSYEKSFIERTIQYITRIELNALMITFLVKKKSVNYNTSVIGSIYLLTIIIRKWWRLK